MEQNDVTVALCIATDVARCLVCVSVCALGELCKTAQAIEMPFRERVDQ